MFCCFAATSKRYDYLNCKSHCVNCVLLGLHLVDYFYILNTDALWIVYFTYFHSMIKCGIISGGNCTNIGWVFLSQKEIIKNCGGSGISILV